MQQFSKFTIGLAVGLSSFYGACTLYGDAQAAYAAYQEGLRVQQYMATHARPIFPANLELHNEIDGSDYNDLMIKLAGKKHGR